MNGQQVDGISALYYESKSPLTVQVFVCTGQKISSGQGIMSDLY